ncbi:TlpA family protein disulfide reductase [Oligella ureolytica]
MAILKKRAFFTKQALLGRLKSLVGRIIALSVVAGSVVLISTMSPAQLVVAQSQTKLRLQEATVTDVDAESLAHLLTTPLEDLEGKESGIVATKTKLS